MRRWGYEWRVGLDGPVIPTALVPISHSPEGQYMALTDEELQRRKAHFWARTAQYQGMGFDRFAEVSAIFDNGTALEGPAMDLGTGMGLVAREVAGRGLEVITVDVDADGQQVAAALTEDPDLAGRITFTLADGAALPFPDGHFGCAVTMDALHHFGDGAPILREMLRVVRPGGLLILAEFSSEGFSVVARVHESEGGHHPEGPVTMDWARGFLAGLGAVQESSREGRFHRVAAFRKPEASRIPAAFAMLDRAGLVKTLDVFAKNWLAHDGCWFLAAEERFGMGAAIELDAASWARFAAAEARRIMDAFGIPANGGLTALRRALAYRMYSFINPSRVEWSSGGDALRFYMTACRVQETRHRKGLPDFPCKSVGQVEFETFARTVDRRIVTVSLHCPPDEEARGHCGWEFRLATADR
jgi:SAM-dependent methyltransferase